MRIPKVFLSYSWDDEEHKTWVRDLATRLRRDGIDVMLDQWSVQPGDQLPHFMERSIRDNDFVLIVCTPKYKSKSDVRSGGVGYEGDIIQGEVFARSNHRKYIPILRKGTWTEAAPFHLLGKAHVTLRDARSYEVNYERLLLTLHGEQVRAPEIGDKPDFAVRLSGPGFAELTVSMTKILDRLPLGVSCLAVSPDGSVLASGSETSHREPEMRVWRLPDGQIENGFLESSSLGNVKPSLIQRVDGSRFAGQNSLAFSPDGSLLASGTAGTKTLIGNDWPDSLRIRRTTDYKLQRTLIGRSVAFSSDGLLLAAGSTRGLLQLWNCWNWSLARSIEQGGGTIWGVAFSPDGTLLGTGSDDNLVRLSRVSDWEALPPLAGHASEIRSIAFSPNGKLLASGSRDRTIRLWRVEDWQLVSLLTGHKAAVRSVAFSPHGTLLASGSDDRTVRMWTIPDGKLSHILEGHKGPVSNVVFSPDGTLIASGSHDKTIRLWSVG
ncbi:MAG TPA: TIR domain-containing protein [Candidatus Elarobacter sp.]